MKKGSALILVFIVLVTLSAIVFAFLVLTGDEIKASGAGINNMRAFYAAEAGRAKARWALTAGAQAAGWGETQEPFGSGEGKYIVTTAYSDAPVNQHITIISTGYIPDEVSFLARREVIESSVPRTGGPNLSLGAAATASSTQGGNTADRAVDGLTNTFWRSSVDNGSWLRLDFGVPTAFDQVIVSGSKIDSYLIEYSTDNVTYQAVTNLVESPAWTFSFDLVTGRYLRFSVNGNRPSIVELETYNSATGGLGQGSFSTSG